MIPQQPSDGEASPQTQDRAPFGNASGQEQPAQIGAVPDRARSLPPVPPPAVGPAVRLASSPQVEVAKVSQLNSLLTWYVGDGTLRYGNTVSNGQHDNRRRAGFAAIAVVAHAVGTGSLSRHHDEDPGTVISDVLGNLRHLADSLDLDYDDLDRRGLSSYAHEIYGL
ncbi:MAG TPA: hypothetical protein VFG15_03100 [Amycolatopsis sp.]|nr:hypothetical protein [Amycolatopsis sp.]